MTTKKIPNYGKLSVDLHKKNGGKLSLESTVPVRTYKDLSIAYSPGVAEPCLQIQKDPSKLKDYVVNGRTIAVITDGSAVLGLGDIGPKAALPVMEGKAVLFKRFAGLNSFPLALDTQDVDKFVETVKMLAPSFGGINLEDISAPRCFEIEERLKKELDIPVFHDDQHGTAIVVLAGLINASKITKKKIEDMKIVVNGAGAAGVAVTKLLLAYSAENILLCDSKGIISKDRTNLNPTKKQMLKVTNKKNVSGKLLDALDGADVFIGLSKADLLDKPEIDAMAENPIIFALANPNPEIKPEKAKKLGVNIIATGRSDYPNQINNVLVFPGIFKGALEAGAKNITDEMKLEAAKTLAKLVKKPTAKKFLPLAFEPGVADTIARAVKKCHKKSK